MLIKEYRVPLPFTLAEYERGHRYVNFKAAENIGQEVQLVEARKIEHYGRRRAPALYTKRVFYLTGSMPEWAQNILGKIERLALHEKAWNQYPYIHTEYSSPIFPSRLLFSVDTIHKENDHGQQYNVHGLSAKELQLRVVEHVDISEPFAPVSKRFAKAAESASDSTPVDPTRFRSVKTGRGPLKTGWQKRSDIPVMCAYKLVRFEFRYPGISARVERIVHEHLYLLYQRIHRQCFCWLDDWIELNDEQLDSMQQKVVIKGPPIAPAPLKTSESASSGKRRWLRRKLFSKL